MTFFDIDKNDYKISAVLSSILTSDDLYKIVSTSFLPFLENCKIIDLLIRKGFVKVDNNRILLTSKGYELAKELRVAGLVDNYCKNCSGKGYVVDRYKEYLKRFEEITQGRPEAIQDYDQGYVTPITNFLRISFAESRGDIKNKKILIMGDDDLLSIALAVTNLPLEIQVFEIDERLVSFIKEKSRKYSLNINVTRFDLKEKMPESLDSYFDVFFSDPPETIDAFKSFIGKGIFALKKTGGAGYFGITLIDASLNKWKDLQRIMLNDFGVVITDMIHDFNEYVNWEYHDTTPAYESAIVKTKPSHIWYKSTIYRIQTLNSKGFNEKLDTDILQDEENATS